PRPQGPLPQHAPGRLQRPARRLRGQQPRAPLRTQGSLPPRQIPRRLGSRLPRRLATQPPARRRLRHRRHLRRDGPPRRRGLRLPRRGIQKDLRYLRPARARPAQSRRHPRLAATHPPPRRHPRGPTHPRLRCRARRPSDRGTLLRPRGRAPAHRLARHARALRPRARARLSPHPRLHHRKNRRLDRLNSPCPPPFPPPAGPPSSSSPWTWTASSPTAPCTSPPTAPSPRPSPSSTAWAWSAFASTASPPPGSADAPPEPPPREPPN